MIAQFCMRNPVVISDCSVLYEKYRGISDCSLLYENYNSRVISDCPFLYLCI